MQAFSHTIRRFDAFELDTLRRQLRRDGLVVTLQPKAFDLLVALVESGGRLLTKDDLLTLVWPGQFVEESNLTVHISTLRKALGERKGEHRFVVTEPGRGYRFVARVVAPELGPQVEAPNEEQDGDVALHAQRQATVSAARPADISSNLRAAALLAGGVLILGAGFVFLFSRSGTVNGQRAAVAPLSTAPITLARLTSGGQVAAAAISPDGKYFVHATTETGGQSLRVGQVGGGSSVQIARPEAVEYWGLTFSPDGAHVYSSVFEPNRANTQLRRVPALGGAVERLPLSPLSAIAFSPDGRRFAFVQTNAAAAESLLKVADTDGSGVRVLARRVQPASFDFNGPTVSWSRDGELIASVVSDADARGDYMTVVGVRADGSGETPLTARRWAGVSEVAWARSGGLVVVAHEQPSMPSQVWLVTRPGGDALPLTRDLNTYSSISMTTDGKTLMLVQHSSISSLWVQSTAQPLREARQIGSEVGGFADMAWTPNGRLVYRSSNGGSSDLWILNADGTAPAQVTTRARAGQGLAVSPDGRYVVFASIRAGKENLWRHGLDDGGLMQLTDGDSEVFPRVTSDSRWVIYQRGAGPGKPTLWRVPIDGGNSTPVVETHAVRHDVSPDGRSVAYFYMDLMPKGDPQWRIGVASLSDGSLVTSFGIPATLMPRVVRFTPDGRALAYIDTVGGVGNIRQQPFAGGPPRPLTRFDREALDTFAYSHDGRRIAMTRVTRISDVALIRNVQ